MKRISLTLAGAFFVASLCAAQQSPSTDLSNFRQEGIASWYGAEFNGRPTASGEIFNTSLYTAAHPTLPFGTMLTVTNLNNGRKVNVRVNDRGPFVSSRIIDLSQAAAQMLDMIREGTAPVLVEAANGAAPAANSGYWAETDSYARSEGGLSSANSQVVAPPYPVYQAPQDPVIIQVQPAPQEIVQAPPQQQITQYFQQPVQQQPQQSWYPQQQQAQQTRQQPVQPSMQQVQPVQQVLPVQQVQPAIQPMRPLAQPVIVPPAAAQQTQSPAPQAPAAPQTQTVQPLQIQIPIEVKPVVNTESPAPSVPAPAAAAPAAPVVTTAPPAAPAPVVSMAPATPPPAATQPPVAPPANVTVILSPETAPAPQIQVTVKPNTVYRVQIGSFKEARNALAAFERLKEKGLSPVYERNGDFFRVVLSGIPSKEMAAVLEKVQMAGFNDPLLREER
jgi:rare lipoprotein A